MALQRSDYYLFGLRQTPYNPESDNKYLYNGKEIQDETGWYDYGARMYDPTLGRFHTPDPLAEEFSHTTIYDYAGNNPISYIDYNGEHPVIIIGGAAIGLIKFGLLATGVISTGWILSRSYQGDISFKSDLFARSRKARNKNKTRNHRQSHSTNRPKRFNPKRTPEGAAAGAAAGMTWSALDFYINHRSTIHPGDYEFKIENYHEFYDVNLNDHFIQRVNFFSPEESNTSKIISPERDPSRIDPERDPSRIDPERIKPGQVEPLPRPVIVPEPEEPELPRQDPLPIPPPSPL
ncbi:RHS repeat domain-containing protein [Geofilum rhodophaeum]|uniref:RHS repeat domain-containing protein n=1 Tax=Geofilum rhodophaeum TaxID=1965019 RepID=UPI000B52138D|nr:RHS repeat-associated core domain-containing protein [Geofilum rhodophaeum]